ncbi:MAG TPA: protein kinase, partial [Blastocatellia bacterium]
MAGRQINNYRIIDYLGSGGFGSVFKAEDINTPGRIVAIKELHRKHTRSATIKQRFFQEALAMARLDHANLPRLHTFGEDQGSYYLVMEFLSGKLLSEEIQKKGPIDAGRAAAIMAQVLSALGYAHRNQIIHRDLKPDNIMLLAGDPLQVKVLDFGIARMMGGENLTLAGEGFGTPAYMSPERIRGEMDIDHRADIYAAGIVLYEMLAGHLPFDSRASDPAVYWAEMRDFHMSQPLPSLASRGVSAELEQIINRATAKKKEDRYATADEMLIDLSRASDVRASGALDARPATLLLNIAPSPAEVYVDGLLRGTSDKTTGRIFIENLSPGLHEVRVSKSGYTEYKISVSLEEGQKTDLQVALAARPTVAMPAAENTGAIDLNTARIESGEDAATALLQVEGLPAGTTIFVDSKVVALAGEDGRATLHLDPGLHEVQATAPSGALLKRTVEVKQQESGSFRTMTFPFGHTAPTKIDRDEPSRKGKMAAAAAAVILLLALAATAYFVIRGPRTSALTDENKSQEELAATQRQLSEVQRQLEELQKKSQDASESEKEKVEAERKRLEAEKKKLEAQQKPAEEKPAEPEKPTSTDAAIPPAPARQENQEAADSNTCLVVAVTGPDGQPAVGVRVVCEEKAGGSVHHGRTGPNGRWHQCGFTPGSSVRIVLFGGRNILGTEQRVIQRGPNLAFLRIDREPRR